MTKAVRIHVYKSKARAKPWTWQMVSRNGNIVSNAAETYDKPGNAKRAAIRIGDLTGCEVRQYEGEQFKVIRAANEDAPTPIARVLGTNEAPPVVIGSSAGEGGPDDMSQDDVGRG
jgi:hypothetical protein